MVTLTIIFIILFVPPARRILLRMLSALFGALGLMAFVTRNSSSPRKQ